MRFESGRKRDLKAETWAGVPVRVTPELPLKVRQRLARDYLIHVLRTQHRWSASQIALALGCTDRSVRLRLKAVRTVLAEVRDAE
jgi:uncharacterized protein YggU (UPF0235/DUF167 family)